MPIKYFEGDVSGNVGTATNWSDNALPVTNDTIIFSDNTYDRDITGDLSAKEDLHMIVGSQWNGKFGTSVTAATFHLDSLDYAGQASDVYIDCATSALTVNVADTGGGAAALSLGGNATISMLRVIGGRGTIYNRQASRTITTVELIGARNATVDIGTVPASGTTLRQDSGTVKIGNSYTNIYVSGGVLEITGNPTAIATLDIYDGKVSYNVSGTTAAITSRLSIYDGEFNASDMTASVATITGAELYENGTLDERNGLETIAWSGGIAYYGGDLLLDAGRVVTIS